MKHILLFLSQFAITICAMSQVKVTTGGNVGVGVNNPDHKFEVNGKIKFSIWGQGWDNIYLDGNNQWGAPQLYCKTANFQLGTSSYDVNAAYVNWFYYKHMYNSSDEKLKENIRPLGITLNKLMKTEGKRYNYKKDTETGAVTDFAVLEERETFGFIAQELELAFPELVLPPNSTNDFYSINYMGMVPVLLEAIKE